jgi:hypothetical protein
MGFVEPVSGPITLGTTRSLSPILWNIELANGHVIDETTPF